MTTTSSPMPEYEPGYLDALVKSVEGGTLRAFIDVWLEGGRIVPVLDENGNHKHHNSEPLYRNAD